MHTFWVFHVCVSCKQQQPTANRKKVKMFFLKIPMRLKNQNSLKILKNLRTKK